MMIPVTKPFLPDKDTYLSYIDLIWQKQRLTNNGPLVQELEEELKLFLGVPHVCFTSSGTTALHLAIRALGLHEMPHGEVITTPFSFIANATSIAWEGCHPVFVDIDPNSFCIDPRQIEAAITQNTKAIMGVHVYGNPCEVDILSQIADAYDIPLLYDSAHAFGVSYNSTSILNYGTISAISFNATKLFHTIEGGAVVTRDPELAEKVIRLRDFGYCEKQGDVGIGLNGKNSELHAAMGLCVLPHVPSLIEKRKVRCDRYDMHFQSCSHIKKQVRAEEVDYNYAYYPILFPSYEIVSRIVNVLATQEIYPRRYFYPTLQSLSYIKNNEKRNVVAEDISRRVLCLPLYDSLEISVVDRISELILMELEK